MSASVTAGWVHRLRERGVIRVAVSYAVIAWLLLQIADVTFGPLGVPNWVMVALIVAAVLGFPVAIALAWFYEIGDRGVERDSAAEGAPRPAASGLRRYADVVIISALLVTVAALLVRQSDLAGPPAVASPAIAVLPFVSLNESDDAEVLALGIAEAVLDRLGGLDEIDVIARSSSFAVRERDEDVRGIGERLGARYLLTGSVRSDGGRLRVNTQLIDATTRVEMWSMRFDRTLRDVFTVQDEIAMEVARALELSLGPESAEHLRASGTKNLAAYLAYLQGRSLLASGRVSEVKRSIPHFLEAIRIDPRFADGHVSLAEAQLLVAEFEVTADRQARFEAALRQSEILLARALTLDPENGHAYLQRGYVRAFTDIAAAEADYRRGLALSPNDARGHAGFAAVLYQQPERRAEALARLDRARRLDPMEPAHDVTKAIFMWYGRGDPQGADDILQDVLTRNPSYEPALARIAEVLAMGMAETAAAARYGEQSLALDPLAEWTRRNLIRVYLDLGDLQAARDLVEDEPDAGASRELPWLLYKQDWLRAGEVAYHALEGVVMGGETGLTINAVRMHARVTGDRGRALAVLQARSGVEWDELGQPQLQLRLDWKDWEVGYADVLLLDGQAERAERLLRAVLAQMDHESRDLGVGDFFQSRYRPIALALLGEHDAALVALTDSRHMKLRMRDWWYFLEFEPAYASLRHEPRFQQLVARARDHRAAQRAKLEEMRRDGLVPRRGTSGPAGSEVAADSSTPAQPAN